MNTLSYGNEEINWESNTDGTFTLYACEEAEKINIKRIDTGLSDSELKIPINNFVCTREGREYYFDLDLWMYEIYLRQAITMFKEQQKNIKQDISNIKELKAISKDKLSIPDILGYIPQLPVLLLKGVITALLYPLKPILNMFRTKKQKLEATKKNMKRKLKQQRKVIKEKLKSELKKRSNGVDVSKTLSILENLSEKSGLSTLEGMLNAVNNTWAKLSAQYDMNGDCQSVDGIPKKVTDSLKDENGTTKNAINFKNVADNIGTVKDQMDELDKHTKQYASLLDISNGAHEFIREWSTNKNKNQNTLDTLKGVSRS